ncbi:hypothetical protein JCM21900_006954 [Sporobolomyces salmonicolor]
MLRTYEDPTNNITKLVKKVELPLSKWDDLKFASDFTEYLASLYTFLEAYKMLNATKHSASSDEAVTSISVFFSSIVSRVAQAKDDCERLDILLYDRSQRIKLAKASASTFNFNVGRWSDSAFAFTSVNTPLPNVYHHLPLSSPYHPHFSSTTSYSSSSSYASSSLSSHIYPIPNEMATHIGHALKVYHEWCSMTGVPHDQHFPISTYHLRMFMWPSLGLYKVDTIKRHIFCLKQLINLIRIFAGSDDAFLKYWRHVDALIRTGTITGGITVPTELDLNLFDNLAFK